LHYFLMNRDFYCLIDVCPWSGRHGRVMGTLGLGVS
jgi:hypothetical protein